MKAIAGILNRDGQPVDRNVIGHMVDNAASWPCQDKEIQVDGAFGLGLKKRYKSQQDETAKDQTDRGNFLITADARVDNRDELIAKLSLINIESKQLNDSDLILKAYEKWRENCAEHILGDFSFAIWDGENRKLFCARDPMGVRPFFYYYSHGLFVFASSITAILTVPNVKKKINELRLAYFVARIYSDPVITMYEDIVRLPAGHCLCVEKGRPRTWSYWDLDPEREIQLNSNEEYEEAMRDIFFDAVRCRLNSQHQTGSMLSGGLDSSSIVCAAQRILQNNGNKPLHTYSAVFPDTAKVDPRIDEDRYICSVSALPGIANHKVRADQCTPFLDMLWNGPEPIPAPNVYIEWLVFKAAREHGVRILLSGHDGDTTVSYGYELFGDLFRKGKLLRLYRETQAACRMQGWHFWQVIRVLGLRPLLPQTLVKAFRFLRGRSAPPLHNGIKLNPDFSKKILFEERVHALERSENHGSTPRQIHISHIQAGLISNMNDILRVAADTSDIEMRFPYFDRRLIEFCTALPVDQKMREGQSRSIMRRAMKDILPPMVQSRFSKGNLSYNFNKALFEYGKTLINQTSRKWLNLIDPYVDFKDMKNNFDRYRHDPRYCNQEAFNVFLVVTLCKWLRHSGL